jgi:solute carrier family 25 (mitochondrial aspartate/glutamate transporter), member 12/13
MGSPGSGATATKAEKPKKLPIPIKLTVGALAGAFGTTCIFPIDMVKTRLQASNGLYKGPADVVRKIYATEGGVGGFYKGLAANLVGVTPEKAIKLVSK